MRLFAPLPAGEEASEWAVGIDKGIYLHISCLNDISWSVRIRTCKGKLPMGAVPPGKATAKSTVCARLQVINIVASKKQQNAKRRSCRCWKVASEKSNPFKKHAENGDGKLILHVTLVRKNLTSMICPTSFICKAFCCELYNHLVIIRNAV